jgi:hypothetical protein
VASQKTCARAHAVTSAVFSLRDMDRDTHAVGRSARYQTKYYAGENIAISVRISKKKVASCPLSRISQ